MRLRGAFGKVDGDMKALLDDLEVKAAELKTAVISPDNSVRSIIQLTAAEYDALETKDPATLYLINGGGGGYELYLGALLWSLPDATAEKKGFVELATDEEMSEGTATGVVPTVKQVADKVAALLPAGLMIWSAQKTAPAGYLECNGAAVNRTTYAALFAAIGTTYGTGNGSTTFNVPDLRDEFVRGKGNSRVVGTKQAEEFKSHNHAWGWPVDVKNAHVYFSSRSVYAAQAGSVGVQIGDIPKMNQVGSGSLQFIAFSSVGGDETRPRNIALLPCIKY